MNQNTGYVERDENVPERETEVPNALSELEKAAFELSDLTDELKGRLGGVLRPEPPEASLDAIRRGYETDLASNIRGHAYRIEEHNACLRSILDRLEL